MTVFFTETPDLTPRPEPIDLNALLRPQLFSKHGSPDIEPTILRCLTTALTNELSPALCRRWLIANAEPPIVTACSSAPRWFRLVAACRQYLATTNSEEGEQARRFEVARRMVARVTSPLPAGRLSWQREVNARVALTIIAMRQLEQGFTSVRISGGYLATQMNLARHSATVLLKTMEKDIRWIRRVGARHGALKWKQPHLAGPTGAELRDRAWEHAATIDALASGNFAQDPLAEVLASVAHPAWSYSQALAAEGSEKEVRILGPRAWIALVHERAGLPDDSGLGLTKAAVRKTKRSLLAELPEAFDTDGDLVAALDEKALATGALVYRAEKERLWLVEAAETARLLKEFKAMKAARVVARRAVGAVLRKAEHNEGVLGPIPHDVSALPAWASAAAAHFNGTVDHLGDRELLPFAREMLAEHVAAHGHDSAKAEKVAGFVFRVAA
ncbi:hypothetical protein SAMN05216368_10910 [Cryobacterium flavum]|uniref:Uncharacterized protein n=1 Tax=Cryobacterium flavum TaxID=1424659 RepID=A0A4R8V2D2_9MICO|nr:hypothetical protein [Cryobacterium flavum]TFB76112.1 hypothetical protein E3O21_11700 [Cryobacterium flavum]SDO00028.1 hypothetical protein SAMN05216368_10910 [Cryobacterium flavum]